MNERDSLIGFFRDNYNPYFNVLFPIITYIKATSINLMQYEEEAKASLKNLESSIANASDKGDQAAAAVEGKLREAESILNHIRQASAESGVARHANLFSNEASYHSTMSVRWLISTIILAVFTILVTYKYSMVSALPNNPKTIQVVQVFGSKLMILSVMYYVLVWAARNYSAHRHNFVVNKHRQNALNTFEAFVKAAEDTDTKNAVLLQATQSIFSAQASGYILKEGEAESPNKIIEIMRSVGSVSK